jgi:hypothetical protein
MKILLALNFFRTYTGSEMYALDLATALKRLGNDVSILAYLKDGDMWRRAHEKGITCYHIEQAPRDYEPDIILASQRAMLSNLLALKLYEPAPIISINHSEIIPEEFPLIDFRIKHYIAIRPAIADLLRDKFYIEESQISLIYNPINVGRLMSFPKAEVTRKTVLFPGGIGPIRAHAMMDMYKRCVAEDAKMIVVGEKLLPILDDLDPKHVEVYPQTWEMGAYYRRATHTASILLGRTSLEGFFFGLPCYIYDIDSMGHIRSMELRQPPEHMDQFKHINIGKRILGICKDVALSE